MRRMLNENFDEDNYNWLASHISARITLTINLSTYQVRRIGLAHAWSMKKTFELAHDN